MLTLKSKDVLMCRMASQMEIKLRYSVTAVHQTSYLKELVRQLLITISNSA